MRIETVHRTLLDDHGKEQNTEYRGIGLWASAQYLHSAEHIVGRIDPVHISHSDRERNLYLEEYPMAKHGPPTMCRPDKYDGHRNE